MKLGGVFVRSIGCVEATDRVDNVAQAQALGKDAEFVATRVGTKTLPQAAAGETPTALGVQAAHKALAQAQVKPDEISLLVFVSQNPEHGGLPHNSAVLQDRLGLPVSAICFDLGLGCSGYAYGLVATAAMMQAANVDKALVVTSDQYRAALKPDDRNTRLLFGDAACATLLDRRGGALELKAARLGTDGSGHTALIRDEDGIAMNGRAVFNFSREVIPREIEAFLHEEGLDRNDLDALLLHQGSRAIVDEIRRKLDLSEEVVPLGLEGRGNTVSSTLPFLLAPRLGDDGPRCILAAGFGVGLSWGLLLLERPRPATM